MKKIFTIFAALAMVMSMAAETWTVAGSPASVFGTAWDPANTANVMADQGDGNYKWEKGDLTLAASTIEFKVVKGNAWGVEYPSSNYQLKINESGVYTITITFNEGSQEVNAVATKQGAAEVIPTIAIAGDMNGWSTSANEFVIADDKKTASLTLALEAMDYGFKMIVAGSWTSDGNVVTRENNTTVFTGANSNDNCKLTADVAGDYTFTWTYATNTLAVAYPEAGDTPVDPTPDPEPEPNPGTDETVYFVNNQGWGAINAYAWAPENAAWPGVAATLEAEQIAGYDVYSYTAPAGTYANVIFNDGAKQTADLVWTAGKYYVTDAWYTKEEAIALLGDSTVTPPTPDPAEVAYVLMGVAGDWTTGIALTANPENENEYMLLGQEIAEGDSVKVVTLTDGVATAWCSNVDSASVVEYELVGEYQNIVLAPGIYDFYYKVAEDLIYIGAAGPVDPTPDPEEPTDITIKAKVPATWTDQITVWVWATGMEGQEAVPVQEGEWYVYTHTGSELNIIFKNGEGWTGNANQTEDMYFTESACIEIVAGEDKATYNLVDCPADDTPVDPTPEPEYYEDVITNMQFDLEEMVIIGGPSEAFQVDVFLVLGEDDGSGQFQLTEESSVAVMGSDATFIDGIAYEIDAYAPAALVDLVVEWNGMLLQFHLTMSAAPMEATVVVVENATLEVEEFETFPGMYEHAAKLTGNWYNEADGLTYPVLVEIPAYYPEATEPYEIMTTVTVGGWADTDPWLGFGEGYLTVSIVDGVVTATGIVENPMAGVAIDITITTGSLTPDVPAELAYVLMGVAGDWTTGIALEANPNNENEYMLLGQVIAEGDAVKVVTLTNGEATAWCGNVDEWSVAHEFDADGNIVLAPGTYDFYYKVAEDLIYIGAAGPVDPTPGEVSYVLMGVAGDWTTGIALTRNESALEEEYVLLNQTIAEGDAVKVVTLTDGVATAWCGNVDEASAVEYYLSEDYQNIVLAPGTYDFYYKVATDNIYIALSTPTGVDNIDVEKKAVKVIRDGQMFIIRDNVVYSVLGQVVK